MKHAREDYNRIQDPEGLIPDDEPVFLIRGQDITGPAAVRNWAILAELQGASAEIVWRARNQAQAMIDWQAERGAKVPDLPGIKTFYGSLEMSIESILNKVTLEEELNWDIPGILGYKCRREGNTIKVEIRSGEL